MNRRTFFKKAAAALAAFAALAALPRKRAWEITYKRDSVPNKTVYRFADPKFIGTCSMNFGDGEWHHYRYVDNKLVKV